LSSDTAPEEITIRLPSYLAKWLKEFAKDLAMTPDQLLANILNYYYEAWRKGFEKHMVETSASSSHEHRVERAIATTLVEAIIEGNDKLKKQKWLIESFLKWSTENNVKIEEVSSEHFKKFLEEYIAKRNIKRSSLYTYRRALRLFIEELKKNL